MKLFVSMAVLCLLAGFAVAAQNGNGPSADTGTCNENCIRNCENQGTCAQQNCQIGEPCQNQNCKMTGPQDGTGIQNGEAQAPHDGSGPLRDGSCKE
jgi:hypothetical protein